MKFLDSFESYIKSLTLDKFKKIYRKITGLVSDYEIVPSEMILLKYFSFIQNEMVKRKFSGNSLNLVMAPRECYKSLTFSRILPLILINNSFKTNDDLSLIIAGSYRDEDAKRNIFDYYRKVLKYFQNIDFLKDTDWSIEIINKKTKKTMEIRRLHSKGNLRGVNYKGKRPQLMILDDMDIPFEEKNKLIDRIQLLDRFEKQWLPAIENGNAMIIVIGIPESIDSIVVNLLKKPEIVNILKLPYKVNGEYIRRNWDENWERDMRVMLGDDFKRQYELEMVFFKDLDYETVIENSKNVNTIALLDMGIKEGNNVLVIMRMNVIIDIISTSFDVKEIANKLLEYNVSKLYVESNTWQSIVINNLLKKMLVGIEIIPMYWNTSKIERCLYAWDKIENKEILFSLKAKDKILKEKSKLDKGENPHALDIIGTYAYKFLKKDNVDILEVWK